MFGVEEYFSKLINEAKSPEEIYKILEYQFVQGKNVPISVFNDVYKVDPTKKKSYTRWLLNRWNEEEDEIWNLIDDGDLPRLFNYFQSRQNSGLNLTDFHTVEDAINALPEIDRVLEKKGNGGPEDNYDIVYDTKEWKIAVPHTYEASEKLGKGCKWCTAGAFRNGLGYFNNYTSKGPLWINFRMDKPEIGPMDKKEYPYTRYQFCFESNDYMDANDERIPSFESIGLPKDAIDFYTKENEEYGRKIENGCLSDEERYERYLTARSELGVRIKMFDDAILEILPEYDYEHEITDTENYYLYDVAVDEVDSISNYRIDKDSNFIVKDYGQTSSAVLVKSMENGLIFCCVNKNGCYEAYEDVGNLTDFGNETIFEDVSHICVYSHTSNEMYEFKINNGISSIRCTNGLPINGDEKNVFDKENLYLEVIKNDGNAILLKLTRSLDQKKLVDLVSSCRLKDGEHFSITMKNGEPILITDEFDYCLDEKSIFNKYKLIININKKYALLQVREGSTYRNIWDIENKYLIFPHDKYNILQLDKNQNSNFVKIEENETMCYIYDVDKKKKVTETYHHITGRIADGNFYMFAFISDDTPCIMDLFRYYKDQLGKECVIKKRRLSAMERNDTINNILYGLNEITNEMQLYDYEGQILLATPKIYDEFQNRYLFVKLRTEENILYDKKERKTIINNIINWYKEDTFCILTTPNESYLIENYTDSFYKVDEILANGYTCHAVVIDGKIYFITQYSGIIPKNGINKNEIANIECTKGDTFLITTSNGIQLKYHAHLDQIDCETPEEESEAKRIFQVGLNEVKQKFYDIFNKINNVKF